MQSPERGPKIANISGPYTHSNLSVFLLHGNDTVTGRNFRTLDEALQQKKILVHETSTVNELTVENISSDVEVFIQSGDIVKGGQQDRLFSYDLVVPPKSGKIPITSFCVESGRWSQRGKENATRFESSKSMAGKDLKIAAGSGRSYGGGGLGGGGIGGGGLGGGGLGGGGLGGGLGGGGSRGSQSAVWENVQETQTKLEKNVEKSVKSPESSSSYQLTLENKTLNQKVAGYEQKLRGILKNKPDVIGFAYAINGRIEGSEIFCSASLFAKQWAKMLKSCEVDALADLDKEKTFAAPVSTLVASFLKQATGPLEEVPLATSSAVKIFQSDLEETLMMESRDNSAKETVLHRSYLRKNPSK
jgi:hypothetical protein